MVLRFLLGHTQGIFFIEIDLWQHAGRKGGGLIVPIDPFISKAICLFVYIDKYPVTKRLTL